MTFLLSLFRRRFTGVPRLVFGIVLFSVVSHIAVAAFVLRHAPVTAFIFDDAPEHIGISVNLRAGEGVSLPIGASAHPVAYAPGMAVLLSPFTTNDWSFLAYLYLQTLVVSILLPLLLWVLARRFFGERVAVVAAILSVIEPLFIFFGWFFFPQLPAAVALLVFAIVFDTAWRSKQTLPSVCAGLLGAVAVYFAPESVLPIILMGTVLVVWSLMRREYRRSWLMLLVAVTLFLSLFPWMLRNHVVSGAFTVGGSYEKTSVRLSSSSVLLGGGWGDYLVRVQLLPRNETAHKQVANTAGASYSLIFILLAVGYGLVSRRSVSRLIAVVIIGTVFVSLVAPYADSARAWLPVWPLILIACAATFVSLYELIRPRQISRRLPAALVPVRSFDVIVPARNEAPVIAETIRAVDVVVSKLPGISTEILVADSASSDGTGKKALAAGVGRVRVVRAEKKGKGRAIVAAARASTADAVAFCDADLSADPSALPVFLSRLSVGADIVVGSRLIDETTVDRGFLRTLSSRIFNTVRRLILGIRVADSQCGLKVFGPRAVPLLRHCEETGWFLDLEVLARAERAGLRIEERPVRWTEFRFVNRKSKLNVLKDGIAAIRAMFRIRYRLATPKGEV